MHRPPIRPLILLTAAMGLTVPAASHAQTWPVATVAAARLAAPPPPRLLLPTYAPIRDPATPRSTGTPPALTLKTTLEPRAPLQVDIPAKAAWTDDQGFRLNFTQLAYKRRF